MPNSKSHRRVPEEKNRRGKLAHRASSFHGQSQLTMAAELRRPKTTPELLSYKNVVGSTLTEGLPPAARLTKLLLNVTIQGSLGPVQVVMSPESTVGDLVAAAVKIYAKECRRPILPTTDPAMFDLHYSQFSLESKNLVIIAVDFAFGDTCELTIGGVFIYLLINYFYGGARFGQRGEDGGIGIEELFSV